MTGYEDQIRVGDTWIIKSNQGRGSSDLQIKFNGDCREGGEINELTQMDL